MAKTKAAQKAKSKAQVKAKAATKKPPTNGKPNVKAPPAKPSLKVAAPRAKAPAKEIVKAPKPAKPKRPSLPAPAPVVAAAPSGRDELTAPRDIARLTRYGERFGANKIDVRWLPIQLPVTGTSLAVFDPSVPKSWRVLDRPVGAGQFRAMLSIARSDDGKERLAAIVIHTGRPPIARWTVAHFKGQKKPKSPDQLPTAPVTSGWLAIVDATQDSPGVVAVPPISLTGNQPIEVPLTDGRRALALPCGDGDYTSYWAVDAHDKPICLVVDFDVFTQKEWKTRPS